MASSVATVYTPAQLRFVCNRIPSLPPFHFVLVLKPELDLPCQVWVQVHLRSRQVLAHVLLSYPPSPRPPRHHPALDHIPWLPLVANFKSACIHRNTGAVLSSAEKEKKRNKNSAAEARWPKALISIKWHKPLGQTTGWLRAMLSFAILRATNLCLRGLRTKWRSGVGIMMFWANDRITKI